MAVADGAGAGARCALALDEAEAEELRSVLRQDRWKVIVAASVRGACASAAAALCVT